MKKGDIITGPTPQELIHAGMLCHKNIGHNENGLVYQCGVKWVKGKDVLSHEEWDKVTCPECLVLRRDQ